jgi:flagellar biosynthesis protein FliP
MDLIIKIIPTFSTFSSLLILIILFLFFSCWVKISTVFAILRLGLGFSGIPSLLVLAGLSFTLSVFVMFPTLENLSNVVDTKMKTFNTTTYENLQPKQQQELLQAISASWLTFLQKNTDQNDLERFTGLATELNGSPEISPELISSWRVVAPAFIISELKKAFSIAFSLFLPFLVIDLVVAAILAAVELTNLESQLVSLPFKLLLFVTIDGWGLIAGNLVKSYVS